MDASTPAPQPQRTVPGEGWAAFAGVWFLVIGVFNVVAGIAGIAEDDLYSDANLFFASLTFWGWVVLIIGALQVLTAWLLFNRSATGQMLGIVLAVLSIFANLFWIAAFPFWSITAIVIAALIIYGLTVHGEVFE